MSKITENSYYEQIKNLYHEYINKCKGIHTWENCLDMYSDFVNDCVSLQENMFKDVDLTINEYSWLSEVLSGKINQLHRLIYRGDDNE